MTRWFVIVGSLWLTWAIRAYNILALPVFVDESLHIYRAQVAYDFTDAVASFLPGKLLVYYYLGLFGLENHSALWLSRQAIALMAPLGAALGFAIIKTLTHSHWAGIVGIWVYALTPIMIFFERMAMSDPFTMVFVMGFVWACLHFAKRPTFGRSLVTGGLLGLALLAKLTTLPLLVIPPLALWLYNTVAFRQLIPLYVVAGLLMTPPAIYVALQEILQFEDKQEVVTTWLFIPEDQSRAEQIADNVETYAEAIWRLASTLPLLMLSVVFTAKAQRRDLIIIGVVLISIWGFILLASAWPSTRYLTVAFPFIIVLGVVGLHALANKVLFVPRLRFAAYGALFVGLWFGSFSVDFIRTTWQDPAEHQLGSQDEFEYFTHHSSAYGLRPIMQHVSENYDQHEIPTLVAGFVGNCHSLRFYIPEGANIVIHCPYEFFYDNPALVTPEYWAEHVAAGNITYFAIEPLGGADLEALGVADWHETTYLRPNDGVPVDLLEPNVAIP